MNSTTDVCADAAATPRMTRVAPDSTHPIAKETVTQVARLEAATWGASQSGIAEHALFSPAGR